SGFKTSMIDTSTASLVAQAVVKQWEKIGVQADISIADYGTVLKPMFTPKVTQNVWNKAAILSTGGTLWGFAKWVGMFQTKEDRSYSNPKVDEFILQAAQTTDPAKKKKAMQDAVVTGRNDYPYLFLVDLKSVFVVGSKIGDLKLIPDMGMEWGPMFETITHGK
ncbi:MAG: hypothetical protein Q7O66_15455, partial [Dehalococcoidia bacterium]|nr:hypothetical protein [Dehalococcoidia bacterium]